MQIVRRTSGMAMGARSVIATSTAVWPSAAAHHLPAAAAFPQPRPLPRFSRFTHASASSSTAAAAASSMSQTAAGVSSGVPPAVTPGGHAATPTPAASAPGLTPRLMQQLQHYIAHARGGSSSGGSHHHQHYRIPFQLPSFMSELGEAVLLFLQFWSFVYVVRSYVIDVSACAGPSMMPTMAEGGDVLIVAKSNLLAEVCAWARGERSDEQRAKLAASSSEYASSESVAPRPRARRHWGFSEWLSPSSLTYAPGDVVVAVSPNNPKQKVCKRVIACAGDSVLVPRGQTESSGDGVWGGFFSAPLLERVRVPEGHVWLQGDNLANSTDSRNYGAVPLALVQGRVVWKAYPLREWGPVTPTLEYAREALAHGRPRRQEPAHWGSDDAESPPSLDAIMARWAAQREQQAVEGKQAAAASDTTSPDVTVVTILDALRAQREREQEEERQRVAASGAQTQTHGADAASSHAQQTIDSISAVAVQSAAVASPSSSSEPLAHVEREEPSAN